MDGTLLISIKQHQILLFFLCDIPVDFRSVNYEKKFLFLFMKSSGIRCSEKAHVPLQEDDMIKMVDILMAADELNEALKIACRILEKSPLVRL